MNELLQELLVFIYEKGLLTDELKRVFLEFNQKKEFKNKNQS